MMTARMRSSFSAVFIMSSSIFCSLRMVFPHVVLNAGLQRLILYQTYFMQEKTNESTRAMFNCESQIAAEESISRRRSYFHTRLCYADGRADAERCEVDN